MKNDLPFDLQEFKKAHSLVVNSQNQFARSVVENIIEQPVFKCSIDVLPHPSGIGFCYQFLTNIKVYGFKVKLYFLTDFTTEEGGVLLSLHFTCRDMFIRNQKIDIPTPTEFTLLWSDLNEKPPRPLKKSIVRN